MQAIRAHVRATGADEVAELLGDGAGHVAKLIPDVRTALPEIEVPDVGDSDAARFQLFDAVTSFLVAVSMRRPTLLVLEDLHVADTPSLLMLRFTSGELGHNRILAVGSYRDPDPDHDGPLPKELIELAREPTTRFLPLIV
jgi:hypothetical protein